MRNASHLTERHSYPESESGAESPAIFAPWGAGVVGGGAVGVPSCGFWCCVTGGCQVGWWETHWWVNVALAGHGVADWFRVSNALRNYLDPCRVGPERCLPLSDLTRQTPSKRIRAYKCRTEVSLVKKLRYMLAATEQSARGSHVKLVGLRGPW